MMTLGLVGLGRMGGNMARRLLAAGHSVVGYDPRREAVDGLVAAGAAGAASLDDLVAHLQPPRTVWIMVPAGEPTDSTVTALAERLSPGDVIIDGGNSRFTDDIRRAHTVSARGLHYVDVGTSGGIWGADRGYCLMIGGPDAVVDRLTPIFRALAPGAGSTPPTDGYDTAHGTAHDGFLHCGPVGAGHFVKMIHNGIEYGLMQAYAEGFDILRHAGGDAVAAERRYDLDLGAIAELWRRGSVVSSWLLDLTARALAADPQLEGFTGFVQDSGEGRWTVDAAMETEVPAHVLTAALYTRFRSRQARTFGEKLLSALRAEFGGHVERQT